LKSVNVVEPGKVVFTIENTKVGSTTTNVVEKALLSIGRVPNFDQKNLESIGIEIENGGIKNEDCRTSVPNIFAVGDATIDLALVNIAELEGRHAVKKMYKDPHSMKFDNLSYSSFFDPEISGSGLNEIQARKKNVPYIAVTLRFGLIDRALAQINTNGFIKILVTNTPERTVVGIRCAGTQSSSIIEIASFMIRQKRPAEDLTDLIVAYPAISQGLQEAGRIAFNYGKTGFLGSIYKPNIFPEFITVKVWEGEEKEKEKEQKP